MSLLDPGQIIKDVHDESNHAIQVNVVATTASSASEKVDDTAFTPGTSSVTMIGATFDDVTPDSVDEGDAGAVRMSGNRNLYTQIRDAAGNERGVNVSAANALKVDGSAVTQPVSAASLPLPSGASTEAKQDTGITSLQLLDDAVATTGAAITTKGFAASGTDGTNARILKTDSSGELQIDVLSSALPSGAATEATLSTLNGKVTACNTGAVTISAALPAGTNAIGKLAANDGVDIGDVTINNAAGASAVNVQDGGNSLTVDGTVAATQSGTWTVQPGNTANTTAWKVDGSAVTQPVSSTLDTSSTSTLSNVASSATSVSLLASTAGRRGAYFFNDSTAILYVKFGTTASATSFTVKIQPDGFFEMPPKPVYTGAIDGIWSAANGSCRITELT